MPDATAQFFEGLAQRGPEPLLGKTKATIRFDIAEGPRTEHWLLGIDDGRLDVSRDAGEMRLDSLHPGATVEAVRETIGWEVAVADDLAATPAPTDDELRLIRDELDPGGVYTK